jgi:hypothetical protein
VRNDRNDVYVCTLTSTVPPIAVGFTVSIADVMGRDPTPNMMDDAGRVTARSAPAKREWIREGDSLRWVVGSADLLRVIYQAKYRQETTERERDSNNAGRDVGVRDMRQHKIYFPGGFCSKG